MDGEAFVLQGIPRYSWLAWWSGLMEGLLVRALTTCAHVTEKCCLVCSISQLASRKSYGK